MNKHIATRPTGSNSNSRAHARTALKDEARRPAWLLPPDHPDAANPSAIVAIVKRGEVPELALARTLTNPTTQAAATIQLFEKNGANVNAIAEVLAAQVSAVNAGDLKHAEAMLVSQASTLNELFNSLARRAHAQTGLHQYETHLRIALRAQAQCCRTLEVLAGIKNPAVIFAKQANVTTGPQQVNNGVPAPAREIEIEQNKLLGMNDGLLPDTGTQAITSRIDSPLEAVGKVHRSKDERGKVEGKRQRLQGRVSATAATNGASVTGAGEVR